MAKKSEASATKSEKTANSLPSFKVTLKCKNPKQKELVKSMQNNTVTICKGVFGVGKSYVIGATALKMLQTLPDIEKIICVVPTVEVGDMHLGLMPGDINEKMGFHIINELDCFSKIMNDSGNTKPDDIIKKMTDNKIIEFRPISNLRGASFRNAIILVSEAEEFTKEELFLIITRFESGKLVISGDPLQSSRRTVKEGNSGLLHACKVLTDVEGIGVVQFEDSDIVRHDLLYTIYNKWKD